MPFEIAVECPVHKKTVYIKVSAVNSLAATKKVLGMTVTCPYQLDDKSHEFVVGSRSGEEEILSAFPLAWLPSAEDVIISSAPTITPIEPLPPTPLETMYRVDPDVAEKQLKKEEWWRRD